MEGRLYHPENRDLHLRRDHEWPIAFGLLTLLALILAASFALVGWPRLEGVSLRYNNLRLRAEVKRLQQEEHRLEIELDTWRSPATLATRAEALGLQAPDGAIGGAGE